MPLAGAVKGSLNLRLASLTDRGVRRAVLGSGNAAVLFNGPQGRGPLVERSRGLLKYGAAAVTLRGYWGGPETGFGFFHLECHDTLWVLPALS